MRIVSKCEILPTCCPDLTIMVDQAFKINYLSTYLAGRLLIYFKTGQDQDPRRWGKRQTTPVAMLAPPE